MMDFNKSNIIILKRKPSWLIVIYLGFWLIGWIAILLTITFGLIMNPDKFDLVIGLLMLVFSLSSLLIIKIFLWNLRGKEKLIITKDEFIIEKLGTFFTKPGKFQLDKMSEFSYAEQKFFSVRNNMWGLFGGNIEFKYLGKTILFGQNLNQKKAIQIIDQLNSIVKK